jgi:hypothetical protein
MREEGLVTGLCPNCQVGIEARAQFSSDGFGFNLGAVLLPFLIVGAICLSIERLARSHGGEAP